MTTKQSAVSNHAPPEPPPPEIAPPVVMELEKEEVELLVSLLSCSELGSLCYRIFLTVFLVCGGSIVV